MAFSLEPLSCGQLAGALTKSPPNGDLLLLDLRPSGQFCNGHACGAENLNFSKILLRRLLKGVVKLESMLSSPELMERVCRRRHATRLVLCDAGSSSASRRPELFKHAEVFVNCLRERDAKENHSLNHTYRVEYVDGGYPEFSQQYPDLCEQTAPSSTSYAHISVSASLPVSLHSSVKRKLLLQSDPMDDRERYGPPVEILPHLILGCERDSSSLETLQELGVTAILNVSHNCPSLFPAQFQYMEIRVPDTYQADLLSRLDEAFAFIDGVKARSGRVLVHCHAGVSRSATVCMAYIMKTLGHDLRTAYDYVKSRRSCVSPNLHFMGQLLEFEKRLGARATPTSSFDAFNPDEGSSAEEKATPLPPLWGQVKRCAISTPALDLCPSPSHPVLTPPTHQSKLHPLTLPLSTSASLPATPVTALQTHSPPLTLASSQPSPPLTLSRPQNRRSSVPVPPLPTLSPCRVVANHPPPSFYQRCVTESLYM